MLVATIFDFAVWLCCGHIKVGAHGNSQDTKAHLVLSFWTGVWRGNGWWGWQTKRECYEWNRIEANQLVNTNQTSIFHSYWGNDCLSRSLWTWESWLTFVSHQWCRRCETLIAKWKEEWMLLYEVHNINIKQDLCRSAGRTLAVNAFSAKEFFITDGSWGHLQSFTLTNPLQLESTHSWCSAVSWVKIGCCGWILWIVMAW